MALRNLKRLRGEMSLEALCGETGISVSQLSRYESGKRDPSLSDMQKLAKRFSVTLRELIGSDEGDLGTIPLVGYVGAGAVYVPFETSTFERIEAPEWANDRTVCAEIRGDSLGSLFDHWLVYYDDVQTNPTPKMLGKLCVVGLRDKRVMVKRIERGQVAGLYTLRSNYEAPIYDVAVAWCAIVRNMSPR